MDRERLLRDAEVPEPPYWALVWIGARAIAGRLLEDPPPPDARVLDLGCGLGLSGVAAGLGGAFVLFADIAAEALAFAETNARLHRLPRYSIRRVDFARDRLGERFDLILAADIVYRPDHYRPLADFLDRHLTPGGRILLTESLRADARAALSMLADRGFRDRCEAIWVEEEGRRERTWLHSLERQATVSDEGRS